MQHIEREALEQLFLFKSGEESFEYRGYVKGVKKVLNELRAITGTSATSPIGLDPHYSKENVENDDDDPRSGPSY